MIFPYSLKDQLLKLEGDNGGRVVIDYNIDKVIGIDIEKEDELMDIDTMENYERAKVIN